MFDRNESWRQRLEDLSNDGTWANDYDILMMANMIQADIFLHVFRDRFQPHLGVSWNRYFFNFLLLMIGYFTS